MSRPAGRPPSRWREFRYLVAEFWREMRADQPPLPVLYLPCDGCGRVTPRTSVQKAYSLTARGIAGGTPESMCDGCRHAQPRVVDDVVPADATVTCTGHQFRRFGLKQMRSTTPTAAAWGMAPESPAAGAQQEDRAPELGLGSPPGDGFT